MRNSSQVEVRKLATMCAMGTELRPTGLETVYLLSHLTQPTYTF